MHIQGQEITQRLAYQEVKITGPSGDPPWENFKESNTCIRDLKEKQKWSKDLRLIINLWPRDPPMATIPEEIIIMSQSA